MAGFSAFKDRLKQYLLDRKAYRFFIKDWVALGDLQACADVMGTMRFTRNLTPQVMEFPKGKRIFVISPHTDDEILGPGGTLIKAIRNGAEVKTIYFAGDRSSPAAKEALRVAERIGYETEFLGFPLRNIPLGPAASALVDGINEFRPETVFLPFFLDDHDDHRRVNHVLLESFRSGKINLSFEVWGYQVYTVLPPNVIVDITDEKEEKAQALRLFESQMESRDWAHFSLGQNAFNSRFLNRPKGARYVEAFFVLPIAEYIELAGIYFDRSAEENYYFHSYVNS
ncbi:MAG: PIG-L deacetylase family protein [Nitrospinota bacterium]|nr:PIG-L deacetylase family protein [Nitrospinota bacterium]